MSAWARPAAILLVAGSVASLAAGSAPPHAGEQALRGRAVFTEYCAMCHGDDGRGAGELAPILKRRAGTMMPDLSSPRVRQLGATMVRSIAARGGAHVGRSNLMPAWAGRLSARQLDDVAAFVVLLPSAPDLAELDAKRAYAAIPSQGARNGAVLFQHHCAACHGADGRGGGSFAPTLLKLHGIRPRDLTRSGDMSARTDRDLYAIIKLGGAHVKRSPFMPTWDNYLLGAEIKDLVSYLRVISHTPSRP